MNRAAFARAPTNRVSPSQIEKKRGCWRKWWYSRHRPRTQHPSAADGERVHKVFEHWLRDGVPPDPDTDEGVCALPGLPYLPMPGVAAVEVRFEMPYDDVQYNGRIDYLYKGARTSRRGRTIIVGDHKTTSNFKWVKTPAQIIDDPQRVIYSRWAAQAFDADEVIMHWNYCRRGKKPAATPVTFVETREDIEARFQDLHRRDSLPIVIAKHIETPDPFPRTLTHCRAFGGCPHRGECLANLSPSDLAVAAMSTNQ